MVDFGIGNAECGIKSRHIEPNIEFHQSKTLKNSSCG